MAMTTTLSPVDFVAMNWFTTNHPVQVDLVYADANHPLNIFKTALYAPCAQLWLHKDLAKIILRAAHALNAKYGWRLTLYDGLRVVEAQTRMHATPKVKDQNPAWSIAGNPYLSLPGEGGHPRGMAVDVTIDGLDMGTRFDDMVPESARDYAGFDADILENRRHLENALVTSAAALDIPLIPLPSEWWDFRFPRSYSGQFAPVHDTDLPPFMRLCDVHPRSIPDDWQSRFDKTIAAVLNDPWL
jgi:D-alanyl-D-alanine dipeptidase